MKIFIKLFLFFVLLSGFIYAGENEYNIKNIPDELKDNADAVIRIKSLNFEVKNSSYAVRKEKIAVTVFNKEGQKYGEKIVWYNNHIEVEEFEGKIFDAEGKEIRELDNDEIKDYSAFNGFSLYEETRIKAAGLYYDKYPYTVEFISEVSYDGYVSWPTWKSRTSLDPVQLSTFEIIVPEGETLRYWCNLDSVKPQISMNGRKYFWKENNLMELSYDVVGEDIEDVALIVAAAPSDFKYYDYKGNMSSWKNFGQWMFTLWKDKDVLPENRRKEVANIISDNDDEKTKVFKLYRYLQKNTRYVSVQLGIGGLQPFDAKYVSERGYGDCKALSNYMISLLKEADIKAYPVLINNGSFRIPIIKDFPSDQFNHVVVAVPLKDDTLWLECTSNLSPPGEVGWGNENREALMITPDGGVLIKTPVTGSIQNYQHKKLNIILTESGAKVKGILKFSGNQQRSVYSIAKNSIPADQEKWILKSFEVPDVKLENFSFDLDENNNKLRSMNINLNLPKYVARSGKRLFFNPNLMERRTYIPKDVEKRLSPVRFSYPYYDIDSISYSIPKEYVIEAIPEEVNISSSFGSFSSKIITEGENEILYVRSLEVKNYLIPAENYSEYRNFFSEIVKSDRSQVVLVKK